MSLSLTWLSHGGWLIQSSNHKILLDPFVSQPPNSPVSKDELAADFILVSHGHFDHINDVPDIARRTGAPVISIFEITQWLEANHGITNGIGMNIGGGVNLPFGHVKMTQALHSSQLPDGSYGGEPVGFVLTIEGKRIYFACDTGLFSDMKLIGDMGITLAVLPIGDLFTMGPEDSIEAIKFIRPEKVAPAHFNTWPPIEQDVTAWATSVREQTSAEPIVVEPGQSFEL
jgi:L-ascorbate metabolism protein UlaG (beta-lactamase superfamily)